MTQTAINRICVIASPDGERFFYLLPDESWKALAWQADGQQIYRADPNRRWYVSPIRAEVITRVERSGVKILGYILRDQAAQSEKFPLTLSTEEWRARSIREGDALFSLYEQQSEPIAGARTDFLAADFLDLGEAEPAPTDGLTWRVDLPSELLHHPEVHHLFPGRLTGFREALVERLKRIRGVSAYNQGGSFKVYAKLEYEPGRKQWLGARLRSGERSKSRGQEVPVEVTRSETINPPDAITGPNRAAATKLWHELMAKYVAAVEEFATHRACGHCDGSGIAPAPIGKVEI